MVGAVRLTAAGVVLFLGGLLWGFSTVEAKGGSCGSVFDYSTVHMQRTTYQVTVTNEAEGCPDAREHRRMLVCLVMIVGAAAASAGAVELATTPYRGRRPHRPPKPPRPQGLPEPPRLGSARSDPGA